MDNKQNNVGPYNDIGSYNDLEGTWTQFWDMHSGGGLKENVEMIYIQAPEEEAKSIFYSRFGHNPDRISCTCCGADYSISQGGLKELTAYHRRLRNVESEEKSTHGYPKYQKYLEPGEEIPEGYKLCNYSRKESEGITLEEHLKGPGVAFIYEPEIADHERNAVLPEEGWVWQ